MKYVVVKTFTDMQDNNYRYEVGAEYPRIGLEVSKARLDELASNKNRRGIALIEEVAEEEVAEEAVMEKDVTEDEPVKKASTPRRGRKKNAE